MRKRASKLPNRASTSAWIAPTLRYLAITVAALIVFSIVLLVAGKDPLRAYADTLRFTFGSS